jgi:hypothetical protein
MNAIDEINVRVSRRPKQDLIAPSFSGSGVRGKISFTEIDFDLDDSS